MRNGDSFRTVVNFSTAENRNQYTRSVSYSGNRILLTAQQNGYGIHIGIENVLPVDLSIYKTVHIDCKITGQVGTSGWLGTSRGTVTAGSRYTNLNNLDYHYETTWGSNVTDSDLRLTCNPGYDNSYIYLGLRAGANGDANKNFEIYKIWVTE